MWEYSSKGFLAKAPPTTLLRWKVCRATASLTAAEMAGSSVGAGAGFAGWVVGLGSGASAVAIGVCRTGARKQLIQSRDRGIFDWGADILMQYRLQWGNEL